MSLSSRHWYYLLPLQFRYACPCSKHCLALCHHIRTTHQTLAQSLPISWTQHQKRHLQSWLPLLEKEKSEEFQWPIKGLQSPCYHGHPWRCLGNPCNLHQSQGTELGRDYGTGPSREPKLPRSILPTPSHFFPCSYWVWGVCSDLYVKKRQLRYNRNTNNISKMQRISCVSVIKCLA